MKLKLSSLDCGTLDLSSDTVPPTIVRLEGISEGCGDLEFRDGLTLLSGLAIRNLLATLELPLGDGRLYSEHAATVSHVTCDGRIRNGFAGELRASILDNEGLCLELASVKAKAHLIAEGLLVKIDGRGGRIEIATLTLKDAQCTIGPLLIRLGVLSVSGLKISWDDEGRPRIEAARAHAKNLHLQQSGTTVDIAAIEVPEGLLVHELVEIKQVRVGAIEVSIAALTSALPHLTSDEHQTEKTKEASPIALDHNIFDTVNGRFDVDATLSVTLPVIGSRVATHHFRIPIDGGILNYLDFERGLADLEDAFINIRLRGQKLVLERDIPLIPGLHKPIITWDLTPGEVELAAQNLVRVRTLPNFKLVKNNDEDEGKKSRFKLHRLLFDNFAIHLSLDETAVLKSDSTEGSLRAHIDDLDLLGSLHFEPELEGDIPPTTLGATARGLGTVADNLSVMGHKLSACLNVASVESFALTFAGLRPTQLAFGLKNISISQVTYEL